jgi:iron-sulfur cluster repair protein YtfE (RIC family)
LTPIVTDSDTPDTSRATAFGRQLIDTHNWLRAQLATARESLVDGSTPPELRDLRMHCLSFCTALTRHHTGEDDVAFPVLSAEVPELAGVIAQLRQDHDMVTTLLADFQAKLADPAATPDALRSHLDGLAAIVESHFGFEERKIAAALDELREPGWGPEPDFLTRR